MPETQELALKRPPVDPLMILQQAVDKGADVATLEKLMVLAERFQENQAKIVFREAMATFKLNPPQIIKNKHVRFGNTEYDHATLDMVTSAITEGLAKVGITHNFKIKQDASLISVTCVLSMGVHSEETTLSASPDTSGAKNAIQAIGSSVTYLQRYTLLSAVGMASGLKDDDGNPSGLREDVVQERIAIIESAESLDVLKTAYADAYRLAEKAKDKAAMKAYMEAKDRQKARIIEAATAEEVDAER